MSEDIIDIVEEYYEDSRYTVEYEIAEHYINFSAIKDESSTDTPDVEGSLKWDGCMNVATDEHYCGMQFATEYMFLISSIYKKGLEVMPNCDYTLED